MLPKVSWQPWRLSFFFAAYLATAGAFAPYFPLYLEHRGLSGAQIGVVMAVAQGMRIFGPTLWGWLADCATQRVLILRMTALATAICFAPLLAGGGFGTVMAVMFATNFCMTAQIPILEAITATRLRDDPQAAARYGRMRAWGSVGFILTVLTAGPMFDATGIGIQPWLVLLLLAATAIAGLLVRDAPHEVHTREPVSVRARLAEPRVRWFFFSAGMMVFAHSAMYTYLSLHLAQLGYSKSAIGVFWVLGIVLEIGFFFVQGRVFARFGLFHLLAASFALAAVRFVLLAEFAHIVVLLVLAQVLHVATFAVHHSASILTIQRWFSGSAAALGQALYISFGYGVGGTAGSLLAAWLWSAVNPAAAFLSSSVAALVGWWAVRRSHKLDTQEMRLAGA